MLLLLVSLSILALCMALVPVNESSVLGYQLKNKRWKREVGATFRFTFISILLKGGGIEELNLYCFQSHEGSCLHILFKTSSPWQTCECVLTWSQNGFGGGKLWFQDRTWFRVWVPDECLTSPTSRLTILTVYDFSAMTSWFDNLHDVHIKATYRWTLSQF